MHPPLDLCAAMKKMVGKYGRSSSLRPQKARMDKVNGEW